MNKSEKVVRDLYERLDRGDLAGVLDAFREDSEVEFIGPDSIPFAGKFHGKAGMGEFLGKLNKTSELLEFAHDEFHATGDFVTAIGHEHGRSRTTGREWKSPIVETFQVRDGKIQQMRCLYDTAAVEHAFSDAH